MIRLNGLNKFFNKGRQNEIHVINNVSLDFPERGMVAIFGKSGCGKTTLLNVIGGLDGFASGSVTVENEDITLNTDVIRNKYIGYIFQNYNLNKGETCFENVADALRLCGITNESQIKERVAAVLSNVGMEKYGNRPPDTLSGGQQQRIAIARAIVKNPKIILADEPTGNLDEANTVMIMDLLKAISKDHLVILVTHEAELVDFYCDSVIELADGRVVSVKNNKSANGLTVRDKNHIYLGELEKREIREGNTEIDYYGDPTEEPIKLRIVNDNGKVYLELGSSGVQILDEFSEIKLKEGVFEQTGGKNTLSEGIDMSKLPPVVGERFGKLFSLRSSLRSGYAANFRGEKKKGKKLLKRCMALFSAVIVFMTAIFGTFIGDLIDAKFMNSRNVFYVSTEDQKTSEKLIAAVGAEDSGIDYVRLQGYYPSGDEYISFSIGNFETFSIDTYLRGLTAKAVILGRGIAEELPLIAGNNEDLSDDDVLITKQVADQLLEKSTMGHIKEYEDLIGLLSRNFSVTRKNMTIAGIVDSEESAVYLSDLALARRVNSQANLKIALASDYGLELEEGQTVINGTTGTSYTKGDTVMLQGRPLEIKRVASYMITYTYWLRENYPGHITDSDNVYSDIVKRENPDIDENSQRFVEKVKVAQSEHYYDYLEKYYEHLGEYVLDTYLEDHNNMNAWIYCVKEIEDVKYVFDPNGDDFYRAMQYKEEFGEYPERDYFDRNKYGKSIHTLVSELNELYETEYGYSYKSNTRGYLFLSDADYIRCSKEYGKTNNAFKSTDGYSRVVVDDGGYSTVYHNDSASVYTLIHSKDPKLTEKWIERELSVTSEEEDAYGKKKLITPDTYYESYVRNTRTEITGGMIAMGIILLVMAVCVYFIMRSSLMNRIKEVGIYRAIGVSKKNLVFRFFVESLVLTTLTVFVGYLLSSLFVGFCIGLSPLVEEIFFYPLWLAIAVFAVIYGMCVLFGVLPIMTLLRKTPSEILAKYDI